MSSRIQGARGVAMTAASTSTARAFSSNVTAGNLLVASFGNNGQTSMPNFTVADSQGNAWTVEVSKTGSNPSNTCNYIAWAVAGSSAACTVTASYDLLSSGGTMFIQEFDVDGTGTIDLVTSDGNENTANSLSHTASGSGVNAVADDVMIAVGTTDGSSGTGGSAVGANWTIDEFLGRTLSMYRLATGTVTGDTTPWTSPNSRPATSCVAVFRRVSGAAPRRIFNIS